MGDSLKLFRILPGTLRLAWILLLIGLVELAVGFFTHCPTQGYIGLGCVITGYTISFIDMLRRKNRRGEAAGFYVGATLAPLIALMFITFVALLGALVLAVQSFMHGFSGSHAIRILHFLGIVFAFLVVTGIPGLAMRSSPVREGEEGELEAASSDTPE